MKFNRLELLVGDTGIERLSTKTVLVLGIGGVGGHCAMTLARSGIGSIILVDKDVVDITNINRQIVALHSTIGLHKVEVLKTRILDVNPDCTVITYHQFYNEESKKEILSNNIDFICDCIDTITFKIDIIKESLNRKIPIISSMGAGNKFHPELLEISLLSKTMYDPIAKVIRTKLRREKIFDQVPVVFSKEIPLKTENNVIGSTSFVPSTAGILCASYVINKILE